MRGAQEQAETRGLGQRLPPASQGSEGLRETPVPGRLAGEAAFPRATLRAGGFSLSGDICHSQFQ